MWVRTSGDWGQVLVLVLVLTLPHTLLGSVHPHAGSSPGSRLVETRPDLLCLVKAGQVDHRCRCARQTCASGTFSLLVSRFTTPPWSPCLQDRYLSPCIYVTVGEQEPRGLGTTYVVIKWRMGCAQMCFLLDLSSSLRLMSSPILLALPSILAHNLSS